MVYKSVLAKLIIPFATVTTATLMGAVNASAQNFTDFMITLPTEEIEKSSTIMDSLEKLNNVLEKITSFEDKILYFFTHTQEVSINLLTFIYTTLSKIVLTTPTIIFNNSFIQNTSLSFSLISISLVTILTVFESIMQMVKQKHTKFKDIIKRYFLVVSVTGFAPFLFEKSFTFLNKLTKSIADIGGDFAAGRRVINEVPMSELDTWILLGFDVVLLAMLFPIFLQNGRRWWDLMCLSVLSPLAGVAFVFDRHRHYFHSWWNNVKRLSLIQLVYSVYILLLGLFIFGTKGMVGWELIIKLIIVAGGLWRMTNPPRIINSLVHGDEKNVVDMYQDYKKGFKEVANVVTLRKFKLASAIKSKLFKK